MSWQEELRKLDEELAAGQISADDYRVRRDQVLSSAVSSGPESSSSQPHPPQESTQFLPKPQQPQQQGSDADKTQIVPGDSDRTQAVGPWQTARPGAEGERTQVVPGVPPQHYAGGMSPRPAPGQDPFAQHPGYQQQQGWQGEDLSPPWAGSDFPPLAPTGDPDWVRQGPELFESGGRGKTGKVLWITLAVVLVLAIAGGVIWLTVIKKSDNNNANQPPATQTSQPQTTTSKPPPTYGPLRIPEGRGSGPKTYTLTELEGANALPSPDLILLKQSGLTEARSVIVGDGTTTISLWSFATPDAKTLAQAMTSDQQRFGFAEADGGVQGVQAYASTQQNNGRDVYVLRAHYVSNGKVIRVDTFDTDQAKARDHFSDVLKGQLEQTPPD